MSQRRRCECFDLDVDGSREEKEEAKKEAKKEEVKGPWFLV